MTQLYPLVNTRKETQCKLFCIPPIPKVADVDVDVDVVDLRAQADASMPASNNNVIIVQYI